ncbi:LacI family DNA-binding transcriptional regulator [Streptomyces sp. NPDC048383]|uniref:LacI family DNA-binding transcriptional regulator n=1 Tax=Streptomyces sp. NPDC048383 TaxID=3155386 RepID=UPI00341C4AC8
MDTGGRRGAGTGTAPTLEDVARAAGVSRATVSRVVNGVRNVDPGIREAVRRAVTEKGYVPNRATRSLVTRRSGVVALVVSGAGTDAATDADVQLDMEADPDGAAEDAAPGFFQDPFFGRVVTGVVRALRPGGVYPVLMFADSARDRAQVVSYLGEGGADGGGERAMRRLLAGRPDLDGVFAANDLMARGACLVLREHGRRVPQDVAVVGFDDSSAAAAGRPRLTTVRQPVEDMAAEMVRLLLDRVTGDGPPEPTEVLFTPTLVIRAST